MRERKGEGEMATLLNGVCVSILVLEVFVFFIKATPFALYAALIVHVWPIIHHRSST